ncbi:MAG: hypothetical protein R2709_07370 [Marmoricola sp.]
MEILLRHTTPSVRAGDVLDAIAKISGLSFANSVQTLESGKVPERQWRARRPIGAGLRQADVFAAFAARMCHTGLRFRQFQGHTSALRPADPMTFSPKGLRHDG